MWLKVKHYQREAFVVGGFVPAPAARWRWRRARGEEPPPVFVRPELTVEVTFLG